MDLLEIDLDDLRRRILQIQKESFPVNLTDNLVIVSEVEQYKIGERIYARPKTILKFVAVDNETGLSWELKEVTFKGE